jgi:hypothetical protein
MVVQTFLVSTPPVSCMSSNVVLDDFWLIFGGLGYRTLLELFAKARNLEVRVWKELAEFDSDTMGQSIPTHFELIGTGGQQCAQSAHLRDPFGWIKSGAPKQELTDLIT